MDSNGGAITDRASLIKFNLPYNQSPSKLDYIRHKQSNSSNKSSSMTEEQLVKLQWKMAKKTFADQDNFQKSQLIQSLDPKIAKEAQKHIQELNQTMDYIQEQNKNIKTLPLINKKRRKSSFFFYDGPTQPQLTKQDTLASINNNDDSKSLMNTQRSFYKRRNTIAQARTPGEKQSINDNKEVSFLKRKFSRNTSKISISQPLIAASKESQHPFISKQNGKSNANLQLSKLVTTCVLSNKNPHPSANFYYRFKNTNQSSQQQLKQLSQDKLQVMVDKAEHTYNNKVTQLDQNLKKNNLRLEKEYMKQYAKFERNLENIDVQLANYAFQQMIKQSQIDQAKTLIQQKALDEKKLEAIMERTSRLLQQRKSIIRIPNYQKLQNQHHKDDKNNSQSSENESSTDNSQEINKNIQTAKTIEPVNYLQQQINQMLKQVDLQKLKLIQDKLVKKELSKNAQQFKHKKKDDSQGYVSDKSSERIQGDYQNQKQSKIKSKTQSPYQKQHQKQRKSVIRNIQNHGIEALQSINESKIKFDPAMIQKLQAFYQARQNHENVNDQNQFFYEKKSFKKESSQDKAMRLITLNVIRDKQESNLREQMIDRNNRKSYVQLNSAHSPSKVSRMLSSQYSNMTSTMISPYTKAMTIDPDNLQNQLNQNVSAFDMNNTQAFNQLNSKNQQSFSQQNLKSRFKINRHNNQLGSFDKIDESDDMSSVGKTSTLDDEYFMPSRFEKSQLSLNKQQSSFNQSLIMNKQDSFKQKVQLNSNSKSNQELRTQNTGKMQNGDKQKAQHMVIANKDLNTLKNLMNTMNDNIHKKNLASSIKYLN